MPLSRQTNASVNRSWLFLCDAITAEVLPWIRPGESERGEREKEEAIWGLILATYHI